MRYAKSVFYLVDFFSFRKTDHPKLYLWSKPWNEDKLSKEKVKQEIKEEPDLNFGEGAPLAAGKIHCTIFQFCILFD